MKPAVKVALFLGWALVLLAGYYAIHKPFDPAQFSQAALSLYNLLISFIILAVCAGAGRKLLPEAAGHPLARLSLQAAVGTGIAGLAWLGLGALGLFRWWAGALVLAAALVFFHRESLAWLSDLRSLAGLWRTAAPVGRFFLLAAAFLTLNQLWAALAPPVKYDALTYHLALPRAYLAQGRLVFIPENPYWGHPQIVEMLYTWAMSLGQATTAAAVSWWAGVLFYLGLAGAAAEHLPLEGASAQARADAAAAALAFTLAGVTARSMLGWAYTDLFSAWYGLAAVLAFFSWLRSGDAPWLRWAGVFCGFAAGTKYTAGVLALVLFLAAWLLKGARKPSFSIWLQSGLLALLVFAPWAVKNTLASGNPLFPYGIPTLWYSAARLAAANLPPEPVSLLSQIFLPITLTWAGVDSAAGPSTDLGPLLVLFALPALLAHRKDTRIHFIILSLGAAWLVISIAGARFGHLQQPRLYFAHLPALSLAAGWGWGVLQNLSTGKVRAGRLALVIAVLVLSLSLWQDASQALKSGAVQAALGLETPEEYLDRQTGVYSIAMRSIGAMPMNSRVLMLWEARSLYAPTFARPDPWIDAWRSAQQSAGSPQAVLALWRSQGFTHILVNQGGMQFMREGDAAVSPAEWQSYDRLLELLPAPQPLAGGYYLLYSISQ